MSWDAAEKIANAVLYEGYLLYPYRASALKNRKRWTFGTVEPGGRIGTEVLVEATGEPRIDMRLRFLHNGEEREARPEWEVAHIDGDLYKVTALVENRSASEPMVSCHALVAVEGGVFVSITDPRSSACAPLGLWPILVEPGLVLASPILLPDFPSIAPESPRDLFDGTEIDEILSLRIQTLTDAEKEEVRCGDERARLLLERTESLSAEEMLALHGARRPAFKAGDRVRLHPRGRADILDLALDGKEACVVAVEQDLEGNRYVAVTVAGDPGSDLGRAGFPGHRFFFRPEEVEAL
jgi:hypothetical protein